MLVRAGVLDGAALKAALTYQEQWGGRLTQAVAQLKLAPEAAVTSALAAGLGVKQLALDTARVEPAALARMDLSFAEQHGIFPVALKESGHTLLLAMADPSDLAAQDAAGVRAKARVIPALVGEGELVRALGRYYRGVELSEEESSGVEAEMSLEEAASGGGFRAPVPTPRPPPAPTSGLDPQRVAELAQNQRKSSSILRIVTELLEEKGVLPRRK
jgi:hypothetical protein